MQQLCRGLQLSNDGLGPWTECIFKRYTVLHVLTVVVERGRGICARRTGHQTVSKIHGYGVWPQDCTVQVQYSTP
jgi:hypothetical protein